MGITRKSLIRSIALAMAIVIMSTSTVFGLPMKDVSSNHWAYNDILEVQRRGLLVTNSKGEFFPNKYVTYFELSQILAKATGYEDERVNPNMDPDFKEEIRKNYEKQIPIIESYAKNFQHWQSDANKEIAYLLGRGYLSQEDLAKFMSRSTSGMESRRGVRKQEVTSYLVHILHKAETAKKEYTSTGFIDESQIDPNYRPYVAYMKKMGIVNGDESGKFGPTQPITRAVLSKMLVDTLKIKDSSDEQADMALEGKVIRMINKSDNSYYIIVEVEEGQTQNFTIESDASIEDRMGNTLSLSDFKREIDTKGSEEILITARIQLIGNTECMTDVKIISGLENTLPEDNSVNDDKFTGDLTGSIYSILIGPQSRLNLQVNSNDRKELHINFDTVMYDNVKLKDITLWDLRLNQEVEVKVVNDEVKSLKIVKEAPPVTINGRITDKSINGDHIDVYVSYSSLGQGDNEIKPIKVPMETKIIEGTRERGRNDLNKGMEVVIIYDKVEDIAPSKIIIISK